MEKNIYYIVHIKDEFTENLKLTTVKKEFCGCFDHESHGVAWFKLNGSGAFVAVPDKWIEWIAPSEILWDKRMENQMTNADKIRTMSDDELASLMDNSLDYFNCEQCEFREAKPGRCSGKHCKDYILKWLKSEVKD